MQLPDAKTTSPRNYNLKILITDDEKNVQDHFMQVAQSHGHNDIDTASSRGEAFTQVIRKNYDLITLGIKMPGVDGLEITAMLRDMCRTRLSPSYPDICPANSPAR